MKDKIRILDNVFNKTDETEMSFKRQLFMNNPPQDLRKHAESYDIEWGSRLSSYMLDYYLKTDGEMKKPDFYEKAGYSEYFYPDDPEYEDIEPEIE
tara:strand:+ start:743 stop:1030 length:288 start_codon:yes stop_codon:yes gene_type:complete